jgi:hypothetical protein
MGKLDFLFEGRPPPSVTSYGSAVEGMPQWLSDYTQDMIARANAAAREPYMPYEGPRIAGLNPDHARAIDITRGSSGQYIPGMQQAQSAVSGALSRAEPYFAQAGQRYPDVAQDYMNPYIENVIDRAGTLTQRQIDEKFLPSVYRTFGAAGASPRSTQMRRTVDQGVRDLSEGLHEQALAALHSGYTAGGEQFSRDASRQGTLGQTIGTLSLESGRLGGALSRDLQDLALRDAAAQEAIGEMQRGVTQQSYDLARQDFEAQRDYPRQMMDWYSNLLQGTPTEQVTSETAVEPASAVGPTGLQQLGALATGIGGIMEILKKNQTPAATVRARGGVVYRKGGRARRGGVLRYA